MAAKKRKKSHKKHCNSKYEVFQMVQGQIEAKHPERRRMNTIGQQQRLINQLKPVLQNARESMRKQGQRQLVPDAEKFFPEAGGQQE